MSAAAETLIRDLSARGIRLYRNGDKLRVEGPCGSITPKLREVLADAKSELLAELPKVNARDRLASIADAEGVEASVVATLRVADLVDCADLDDDPLRAFLRCLRDTELRARGKRPDDETALALCVHCGPVWLRRRLLQWLLWSTAGRACSTVLGATWLSADRSRARWSRAASARTSPRTP